MEALSVEQSRLEQVAELLGKELLRLDKRLVTVESCTGGGIAQAITSITGSSAWFDRGLVTYSNRSKTELCGVPRDLIDKQGAVSLAVAQAMVEGAVAYADIALAVTGVAGPDGGTAEKPVGTVCFSWAAKGRESVSECRFFKGDRAAVRLQASLASLQRASMLIKQWYA